MPIIFRKLVVQYDSLVSVLRGSGGSEAVRRRCQELSNGSMVQGVADLWGRDDASEGKDLVSPEQLRTQLARVRMPYILLGSCCASRQALVSADIHILSETTSIAPLPNASCHSG